jgi:hypothetical protein
MMPKRVTPKESNKIALATIARSDDLCNMSDGRLLAGERSSHAGYRA